MSYDDFKKQNVKDRAHREDRRTALYKKDVDDRDAKIRKLEQERSLWMQRAFAAETKFAELSSERPLRVGVARILYSLAKRLGDGWRFD